MSTKGILSFRRFAGFLAVGGFCAVLLIFVTNAKGQAPGYVFSNLTVMAVPEDEAGDAPSTVARIMYSYAWATSDYPGMQSCTWTVYDEAGASIGSVTNEFVAMAPSGTDGTTDVLVSGEPSSAEVSCDPETKRDPGGHYEFSNLDIGPWLNFDGSQDDSALAFSYDAVWVGAGPGDPRACTVTFHNASGQSLFTKEFTVLLLSDAVDQKVRVEVPSDVDGTPTSTSISCDQG